MEQLVLKRGGQTCTTSKLVADKFNREHKNVLQAIENLECSEEFGRLNFQPSYYLNSQNKPQPMCYITRDGFSFLVMGFTGGQAACFKEEFIKAFNQMERKLESLDPSKLTRLQILQLALESEQENLQLQQENAKLQLKVDVLDQMITAREVVDVGQASKILGGIGRNRLFRILREQGILFRSRNEPKQHYIESGYFKLKEVPIETGSGMIIKTKIYVTQRGLAWLHQRLGIAPQKLFQA